MAFVPRLPCLSRAFAQGARSARANPLRSGLGVLAIAVAVATLAAVHTAVEGLTLYARQSTARAFGADSFVLARVGAAGQVSRRELARKQERNPPLRRADHRFLAGKCQHFLDLHGVANIALEFLDLDDAACGDAVLFAAGNDDCVHSALSILIG